MWFCYPHHIFPKLWVSPALIKISLHTMWSVILGISAYIFYTHTYRVNCAGCITQYKSMYLYRMYYCNYVICIAKTIGRVKLLYVLGNRILYITRKIHREYAIKMNVGIGMTMVWGRQDIFFFEMFLGKLHIP